MLFDSIFHLQYQFDILAQELVIFQDITPSIFTGQSILEEDLNSEEIKQIKLYLSEINVTHWGVFGEKIIGDGMRSNEKVIDKGVKIEESYLTLLEMKIHLYKSMKKENMKLSNQIKKLLNQRKN